MAEKKSRKKEVRKRSRRTVNVLNKGILGKHEMDEYMTNQ